MSRVAWLVVLFVPVLLACGAGKADAELAALEARQAEVTAEAEAARAKSETSTQALAAETAKLAECESKLEALETDAAAQAAKMAQLESEKDSLEGELEKKQAALEAVKALQDALAKTLVEEIETGDIRVSERGGYLVIDVSDKVLFATGEAELSERGQKVISKLAESLVALPKQSVFQVGGHTDNQQIKSDEVKSKYPTNWELSAARATNVVRYLEETCKVPGERLVAAGFSQFRPVASNSKPANRSKNRRIEIALLPPRS